MYEYECKKILVEWIRDSNGHKIGAVVALEHGEAGWSLCNVDKNDTFRPQTAINKAIGRAVQYRDFSAKEIAKDIGYKAKKMFIHMLKRSMNYYQHKHSDEERELTLAYIDAIETYKPAKNIVKLKEGQILYHNNTPVGTVTSFTSSKN